MRRFLLLLGGLALCTALPAANDTPGDIGRSDTLRTSVVTGTYNEGDIISGGGSLTDLCREGEGPGPRADQRRRP